MADDFQVKQGVNTQSSSGAYGLTGGVLGGVGAGLAAHYLTKPKYGSFEEIIAESKDSFDKKIEAAKDEEKEFLQKAKELAGKRQDAEAEYDKKFAEWKEKNPANVKVETDEYKKLVDAEKTANEALTSKKNELIKNEVEKLKNAGASEKTATIDKSLKNKARQIFNATKRYEELKATGASKEEIAKAAQTVEALQKEADELATKIAEKLKYGKLEGDALAAKKKEVAKAYKLNIQDRVNANLKGFDRPVEPEHIKLSNKFLANRKAIVAENKALEATEAEIEKLTGINMNAFKNTAHSDMVPVKVAHIADLEQAHLDKLNTLKEAYTKATEGAVETGEFSFKTLFENLKKMGTPGAKFEEAAKDVEAELTKYLTETKGLSKEQQEAIRKLVNGEINEKSIQDAINASSARIESIKATVKKAIDSEKKLEELNKEAQELKETMNKKGVYIREKDGVVIDKNTGKPVEAPKAKTTVATPKVKLPKTVNVPKDVKIEYTSRAASTLSEEELRKQAEAGLKADAYKAEAEAVETAKKARETAYGKLADGKALTDAERETAFLKEIGAESKTKYAEKAVEDAQATFKKDCKKFLERKYGFAEHANWKIAGVAAAGALVVGAIASALAPKHN